MTDRGRAIARTIYAGRLPVYQELKGKSLQMGQIQFWRMSEPHKSPTVATANYAKVYLQAGDKTYRLLLEKKDSAWRVISLSDRLSGF